MPVQQNIPIWVLNLKRDEDRRQFIQTQLQAFGVEFEMIEAVDGRSLTEEDLSAYSENAAIAACGRPLSRGEIGCALSHIKIWKRIIREKIDEVLVLEDDIKIGQSLFSVLDNKSKFPGDYEFVNFLTDAPQIPFGDFVFDIYRVSKHKGGGSNRTCLYLITHKGAEKLLSQVYPIRKAADGITGNAQKTMLTSYGIYPRVAVLSDFESSIWENDCVPQTRIIKRAYFQLQQFFQKKSSR